MDSFCPSPIFFKKLLKSLQIPYIYYNNERTVYRAGLRIFIRKVNPLFKGKRYLTSRSVQEIPWVTILVLWEMIDGMRVKHRDREQLFELYATNHCQIICHMQQEHPYLYELELPCAKPVDAKVYIVDKGTYSIMMLADKYESQAENVTEQL